MEKLGYSLTWRTRCFIRDGIDCGGKEVFAHTNGFGDFVLFDELGWPWPVHQCYVDRFSSAPDGTRNVRLIRVEAIDEYRRTDDRGRPRGHHRPRDIQRISPDTRLKNGEFVVLGYVQDYIEDQVAKLGRDHGTLGLQHIVHAFGHNRSQLTIITSEFESFTAFADLRNVVVQKKDIVAAHLRAMQIVGVRGTKAIFVCEKVSLIRGASEPS